MKNKLSKIYGYVRISTPKQSIDRQIRNIKSVYPSALIVEEIFTGTKINRPEWNKLYKVLNEGSILVVDSCSRLSRNASEGFEIYEELYNRGVDIVFLKEPHINTETYKKALNNQIGMTGNKVDLILDGVNKYLLALAKDQIRIAFEQSEKEVADLHQRTREGIETARRNGKQIGQKKGNTLYIKKKEPIKKFIKEKSKDFDGYNKDVEIMSMLKDTKFKVPSNPKDPDSKKIEISGSVTAKVYYQYKREIWEELEQ